MTYVVEVFGDLPQKFPKNADPRAFPSLEAALQYIEETFCHRWDAEDVPDLDRMVGPDPEDDRILVREILGSGHMKVVWHFSGWHWDSEEFGIPQGKLLGHELPLYAEVNE